MIAEIVATGDEIRSGAIVDRNSAYIAEKLEEAGFSVVRHMCVGDDLDILAAVFNEIGSRADIAVVTGGLGPTSDDLTAAAAAKAVGVNLVLNRSALRSVENFFKARQRKMNRASRKQAMLPEGSEYLKNLAGTAPGFSLEIGKCMFFFLPGVPHEMHQMFSGTVLQRLIKLAGFDRNYYLTRTLSTFGLTESQTYLQLADLESTFAGIRLGLRVKFPLIEVKLYVQGVDQKSLADQLNSAAQWVIQKLGTNVVSQVGDPIEKSVGLLLIEKQASVAVAESCTGGLISHMLTNIAGSSAYFVFCGITYSNQAKIDILDVSAQTLETHGAVHEETAKEMAMGARRISGATYGLATSGIAGPSGGSREKPVGTVCIGLATAGGAAGHRYHFGYANRDLNKQIFAVTALDVLRKELLGVDPFGRLSIAAE